MGSEALKNDFQAIGEAGGEGGAGGGVCAQVTDIGLVGSVGEKDIDVTFVRS